MENELHSKVKQSIQTLRDKQARVYFLVQDTKGNPKASIKYIYDIAKTLKNNNYNPIIIHETKEYEGVSSWLDESYMDLPHQSIDGQNLAISPEDIIVLPNAGFIYCADKSIPSRLLGIALEYNLTTLVEEFAMFIYSQSDFKSYILKYEPSVIFGRPIDTIFTIHNIKRNTEIILHNKIEQLIRKNVYLTHQ